MARSNPYDLSSTYYLQDLDQKTNRYSSLIRKAEETNRANGGAPTKQEAKFYYEASKVCEEIISQNVGQPAMCEKWKGLKLYCDENITRITDILAPAPAQEEPAAEKIAQKVSGSQKKTATGTVTQTASGFKTRHATKEVTAEQIESWFQKIPDEGFAEYIGKAEVKGRLLHEVAGLGWEKTDDVLQIHPVKSYFLYGPPGTGKTHLIKAFAHELSQRFSEDGQTKFSFIQLSGSDIHASFVGMAEKAVKAAFAVAEEYEPCLLFMDEIDNLCVRLNDKIEGHERRLTVEFMQAYNRLRDSGKKIIFMGATNHPGKVAETMLDRCSMIPIPLPSEADRAVYFRKMLRRTNKEKVVLVTLPLEPGFTPEEMAAATDNHSYRDLDRLRESMLTQLKIHAIAEHQVLGQDGKVDQKASDEQASQAILEGKYPITRAIFIQAQKENPPSDKAENRQELKEFEARIARMQQQKAGTALM